MKLSDFLNDYMSKPQFEAGHDTGRMTEQLILIRGLLPRCHRFVLSYDAREALKGLKLERLVDNWSMLRLPYDLCWFEMPCPVNGDEQGKGGLLIRKVPDAFMVLPVTWSRTKYKGMDAWEMWTAQAKAYVEILDGQLVISHEVDDPLGEKDSDTAGILSAIVLNAVLLMNTPGTTETVENKMDKINKKRERNKKQPLFSFTELRIKREVMKALAGETTESDGKALHWRRGHFKQRKSGLYWWNPHLAGNSELGIKGKDYKV